MNSTSRWIFLLFLLCPFYLFGQIYLQIEKKGSTRTHKIPVGEVIKVQLKGRDYYIEQEILKIIPKESVIITESEVFFVTDIEKIIPKKNYYRKGRFFVYPFYSLGVSATISGVIGSIYEGKLKTSLVLPGPIIFFITKLIHKYIDRPYVQEKGWRWRIVDLRMTVPIDEF